MKDITLSQGYLYATIIEGVLYGFNLALFISYISAALYIKVQSGNQVVRSFICLMFVLSTAHLAGSICSIAEGFFGKDHDGGPDSYFGNRALPLSLVNKSLYGTTMVIGDALLIYRVWAIYRRDWRVVALPILTLLGTVVCAALIVWGLSQLGPGQTIFQDTVMTTAPAMFVLPFVTNVMITALILVQIKRAKDNFGGIFSCGVGAQKMDTIYKWLVLGAIESCVVYPVYLLLAIVLYSLKTNVFLLVTGSMTQVVAIVPTLMWLQIILGLNRCDVAARGAGETAMGAHSSPRGMGFRTGAPQGENGDGVEETAMSRLEEGRSNSGSQFADNDQHPTTDIETISRTDVARCTA